jgi:hypothetical protein
MTPQYLVWAGTFCNTTAEDGFPCYPLFERDLNLDGLRRDGRFITFLGKLKRQWEYYLTFARETSGDNSPSV